MTDNVLPFLKPGTQVKTPDQETSVELDEATETVAAESTNTPANAPSFLDWVYAEVLDFTEYAKELVEVAERQGPDAFWSQVERLKKQINGWSP